MGRLVPRNHLPFISLILVSILFTPISQNLGQTLGWNDYKNSGEGSEQDWLLADSDGDGLDNGEDSCPFWSENNCSLKFNDTNQLYSRVVDLENETIASIDYSPDGRYLAIGSFYSGVTILDLVSYEIVRKMEYTYYSEYYFRIDPSGLAFSNDGETLAVAGDSGLVLIDTDDWSITGVYLELELSDYCYSIWAWEVYAGCDVEFSPNDEQIAIRANLNDTTGIVYIWNMSSNVMDVLSLENDDTDRNIVEAIGYSKDGEHFAIAQGNQLAVYNTSDYEVVLSIKNENLTGDCQDFYYGCTNYITDLQFSNDGKYLAVVSINSSIELYSTNLCQNCSEWSLLPNKSIYLDYYDGFKGILFSPDSNNLIGFWTPDFDWQDFNSYSVIKIYDISSMHDLFAYHVDIHASKYYFDEVAAISPDGNSIALSDNDWLEDEYYWEMQDRNGIYILELDSDSDGIRDSIDACDDTEEGADVNDIGCSFKYGPSSEFLDGEHLLEWLFITNFVAWFFMAYRFLKIQGTKLSSIPWILPLFFVLILTYAVVQIPGLSDEVSPTGEYYYCPDGTRANYDELPNSGLSESEFEDNPPEHWCNDAVIWATDLSLEASGLYITTIMLVCSALFISAIIYSKQNSKFLSSFVKGAYSGAQKQVKKIHKQYKQKQKHKQQQKKMQTNQLNHNQVNQPKIQNQNKPYNPFVAPPLNQQKKPVQNLKNQSTQILSPQVPAVEKTRTVTVDSKGITTIETGFSKVTLDKYTDLVTKIPQGVEQHPMFIQEIKNMNYLDEKGYDVGLIDCDEGASPKIVTRYMGPSKLSEHYKTLSVRGKKNMIEELVEHIAHIHKCGMVHRDLKPDNILVDARPRDGNHQFDAIIDYGIAMKINRRQTESYNTAGTKFFGHSSQKDPDFKASTGQDWFALARIFALLLRGVDIDSLNAEIQMSQTGLEMSSTISTLGFDESIVQSISELIVLATDPNCEDNATIGKLAKVGKALSKKF